MTSKTSKAPTSGASGALSDVVCFPARDQQELAPTVKEIQISFVQKRTRLSHAIAQHIAELAFQTREAA